MTALPKGFARARTRACALVILITATGVLAASPAFAVGALAASPAAGAHRSRHVHLGRHDRRPHPGRRRSHTRAHAMRPSLRRLQGAVDWAWLHLGDAAYDGWCGRFVANAFGSALFGWPTAWDAARALKLRGGTPPPGALVFFRADPSNGGLGHVGIV